MSQDSAQAPKLPPSSEDSNKIRAYLSDESAAMIGTAEKVWFPSCAAEAAAVLKEAGAQGKHVTVSAAGTSITGARVPLCGGWILSIERMRNIPASCAREGFELVRHKDFSLLLSREKKLAAIPPGIRLDELDEALERFGLVYPPDPTEMTAMIGGTVATNASGARSFCYGPTRKWVEGMQIVLPSGEIVEISRGANFAEGRTLKFPWIPGASFEIPGGYPCPDIKNTAGLHLKEGMDLIDLFIGDEGLLGIVCMVSARLAERPEDIITCIAFFDSLGDALGFAGKLRREGSLPRKPYSIEFFDRRALEFMRSEFPEIPEGKAGAILFEYGFSRTSQHNPYPCRAQMEPLKMALEGAGAAPVWTSSGRDIAMMKKFRHALPETVNKFVRTRAGKLGTDMAVPEENFMDLVAEYEKAERCGVRTVYFGHIGSCHLHLNFLPENKEELAAAKKEYLHLARTAVKLGGTISAEHGIGKKRIADESGKLIPYFEVMAGRTGIEAITSVKRIFDPKNILNKGNMVDS